MSIEGVNVPASEGGGGVFGGTIWEDIITGVPDLLGKGLEAAERWYELEFKRDLAQLQLDSAQQSGNVPPIQTGTVNPGPFEDISAQTLMIIAGGAVLAIILLRR